MYCADHVVASLIGAGRAVEAVDLALHLIEEDELREQTQYGLVRAYAAMGNRMLAKRQYGRLRVLTFEHFGCEPILDFDEICAGDVPSAPATDRCREARTRRSPAVHRRVLISTGPHRPAVRSTSMIGRRQRRRNISRAPTT
jgi:DNA-binding SARP family transcriptional activator